MKPFSFGRATRRSGRAACVLAVSACCLMSAARAAPSTGAGVEIGIEKFAFSQKEVTIKPGTKVVWVNHDETPHTVTGTDKSFASKGMDTDDRFEHVFSAEGDFSYVCTLHPFMTGMVHVRKQ